MSRAPAAIVLAGGRSTRMGASKASLDWHGMPLVARIAGIAGREFAPVLVVASPGQPVPAGAERVEDRRPGRGPLEGIAAGMRALDGRADAAIVTSTDAPFLHPAFLQGVAAALGDHDVAVPVADGREHPLTACWSLAALAAVEAALAADRLRVRSLLGDVDVAFVDGGTLEHPESLRNLNTPEDYRAALGEPLPRVTVIRPDGGRTLRRAAALPVVELNGSPVGPGSVPLVEGDIVSLAR
jgi:molybdopterin-guanine dinucleotide biosynthesis protein A